MKKTPAPFVLFAALDAGDRVLGCGDSPELARGAGLHRLVALKNPAPHQEHIQILPIDHGQAARIERGQRDAFELEIKVRRGARGGFSVGVYDERALRDYLEEHPAGPAGYICHGGRQPRVDRQLENVLREGWECGDAEIAWFLTSLVGRHLADKLEGYAGTNAAIRDEIASFLASWAISPSKLRQLAAEDAA